MLALTFSRQGWLPMFMLTRTACLVALVWALPGQSAMTIQPDPQNSGGYVMAAADLASAAQAKTANLMYGSGPTPWPPGPIQWWRPSWHAPRQPGQRQAGRAGLHRIGLGVPDPDGRPGVHLRALPAGGGQFPPSAATTRTGAMRTPSARSPSSPPLPTLPRRPAATLPRRMSPTTPWAGGVAMGPGARAGDGLV